MHSLYCSLQTVKMQQYRFSVIMIELQATENASYMATVLSVINALIFGIDDLRQRDKLRKEFVGRFPVSPWVRRGRNTTGERLPPLASACRARQLSLRVSPRIGPSASFPV